MTEKVFLTPSTIALLELVSGGPPADPSPTGQRSALDGAIGAIGWQGLASDHSFALASGADVHMFSPLPSRAEQPLLIYFHGGSFLAGGMASHGGIAATLARKSGAMVALVDYRLTPEHPLPAGLDDAISAISALAENSLRLPYNRSHIAILGDSAGAWLAASAVAILAGQFPIDRLVLINPMITPHPERTESRSDFAAGYFAQTADFDNAWSLAGTWASGRVHPGDNPASLSLFPPTVLLSNEADPVRDEGEAFAEALSAAGIPVVTLRSRGLVHAAWLFPKALPEAELLVDLIVGAASGAWSATCDHL